ncbi:hypothetical protein CHS0354_018426 [Potamilus streckersoni]|uniref:Bacteriophage Mu GpT domain-containing protein n=1 Tax=Potamilus streckersoni TaxID=2493646 RepID=A0AAE0TAK4_9BIVA|nr:hypothetical protein CHS0354_018426 [Potamilus streckersoni]
MAIIKDTQLDAIRTAIRSKFNTGLSAERDDAAIVSTEIYEPDYTLTYAWLDGFPKLKTWASGSVPLADIKERSYKTQAIRYGSGVEISLTDIELDRIGHYGTMAEERGREVVKHKNRLVFGHLKSGETKSCFDGQYFFDTDHPVYPTEDGTGSAYTDVSKISNHMGGTGTAWYLLSTNRTYKPIIYHTAIKPELRDAMHDDDAAIRNDSHLMTIKTVVGTGFGFWQTAVVSRQDLTKTNFEAAMERMMGFVGNGGDPLGIMPDMMVVPPSLRSKALDIVKATQMSNGASNTNYVYRYMKPTLTELLRAASPEEIIGELTPDGTVPVSAEELLTYLSQDTPPANAKCAALKQRLTEILDVSYSLILRMLTFTPAPDDAAIKAPVTDVAVYRCYVRSATETVKARYENALKTVQHFNTVRTPNSCRKFSRGGNCRDYRNTIAAILMGIILPDYDQILTMFTDSNIRIAVSLTGIYEPAYFPAFFLIPVKETPADDGFSAEVRFSVDTVVSEAAGGQNTLAAMQNARAAMMSAVKATPNFRNIDHVSCEPVSSADRRYARPGYVQGFMVQRAGRRYPDFDVVYKEIQNPKRLPDRWRRYKYRMVVNT